MSEYHEKREELKGLLTVQLILAEESDGAAPSLVLNQLLAREAGRMLEHYEKLSVEYLKEQSKLLPEPPTYTTGGFAWGAAQSLAASVLFILLLYLASILLDGTSLDVFRPLRHGAPVQGK